MPPIGRPQLLLYGVLALLVVALGARALRDGGGASAPPPAAVVEGARPAADAGPDGAQAPAGGAAPAADATAETAGGTGGGSAPPSEAGTSAAPDVLVHVAGAVARPGVYRVAAGARVQDAVELAGGPRAGADAHALNLAAKVTDGQQVVVPRRGKRGAAPSTTAAPAAPAAGPAAPAAGDSGTGAEGGVVNVNTASPAELETLDGVGPAIAEKIVAWRQANGGFRSVDDLAQVSGIGPKKLEAMRSRVGV